jgi:L-ascorbate metabolism protein UlaG (beta-lactamase superfamily)
VEIVTIGGPTALVRYGSLSLLTDPAFDPPRDYETGRGYSLVKLTGPALTIEQVGPIDLVLLSHDQHWDNFDAAGREFAASVPAVLTTPAAAERLGANPRGMATWSSLTFDRADDPMITVTSTPALHGPPGSASVMGEVTGFVLTADGLPTVYVSGDNASLDLVAEVRREAGPIDVAILFVGAAQTAALGDQHLTLTSAQAVDAAIALEAAVVVPVHYDGWAHFTEGAADLEDAFAAAGLRDRLELRPHGQVIRV